MNKRALFSIVAIWVLALVVSLFSAANTYSQSTVSITLTPFDCDQITRTAQITDEIVAVLFGNIDLLVPDDAELNTEEIALQLQLGDAEVVCEEPVPPLLILHRLTESEQNSTITINGNPVQFDGTIAFELLPDINNLQLIVLSGSATADDQAVAELFTIQILLTEDGTEPLGVWVGNRPVSDDVLPDLDEIMALFEAAISEFVTMTPSASGSTVNNVTGTPCSVSTGSPRYIIQAGDTLSGIASRASTTVNELMRLNCMASASVIIIAGQGLYVPRIPIPRPTATYTYTMTFTVTFAPGLYTPTFTVTYPVEATATAAP